MNICFLFAGSINEPIRMGTTPNFHGISLDSWNNMRITRANNGDTNYVVQQFTFRALLLTQWNSANNCVVNRSTFDRYGILFDSSCMFFIAG